MYSDVSAFDKFYSGANLNLIKINFIERNSFLLIDRLITNKKAYWLQTHFPFANRFLNEKQKALSKWSNEGLKVNRQKRLKTSNSPKTTCAPVITRA